MLASLQLARRHLGQHQRQAPSQDAARPPSQAPKRKLTERPERPNGTEIAHQERELGRAQESLARAEYATRRIIRLVSDLLETSRIQSGKLQLQVSACDLASLVRDVVGEQRALHAGRHILLRTLPREPVIVQVVS